MLTAITAENFKCFGTTGVELQLAPLTILVGPNGSGKSSVLDAICLLAQTAETAGQKGGFNWQGPWVDFGHDGTFAFNRKNVGATLTFAVSVKDGECIADLQRERGLLDRLTSKARMIKYAVAYSQQQNLWSHALSLDETGVAVYATVPHGETLRAVGRRAVVKFPRVPGLQTMEFNPSQSADRVLLPTLFSSSIANPNAPQDSLARATELQTELTLFIQYLDDILSTKVFLVAADRSTRDCELRLDRIRLRVGRRGEYTPALLSLLFNQSEYGSQAERIRHWAGTFGLERLGSGWVGGPLLQASYYDSRSRTPLPSQYAGFGSQQILPVITQLFAAPPGSLVMIEEPEISLHPEAQVSLIRMFADAIQEGRHVLITTHSPTLLLSLSEAAKEHGLVPKDVAIYHFSRDRDEPIVQRLELDETWYIKGWVPSFSKVETRLMKQWIDNVRDKLGDES